MKQWRASRRGGTALELEARSKERRPADGVSLATNGNSASGDGILGRPPPDYGCSHSLPAEGRRTAVHNSTGASESDIPDHRERILQHISDHRVTFIQGETGSGKSTTVPQFILDDATARGRRDSVRVVVAQPRRVAAVSLAQYVAHSRGERVGMDVGYAVRHERAVAVGRTRLTFVTTGYLLQWLANDQIGQPITHIILDEVHVRSVEQDLLLLLVKMLLGGIGRKKNDGPRERQRSFRSTKLIIMSATMEVRPLQEYFSCLLTHPAMQGPATKVDDAIIVRGRTFPVEIVHMDEILAYLPDLPKEVADLGSRFLGISGTGVRALDGSNLPRFAIDLITGLVMHVGKAGDCVLVFVASFSDIFEIKEGFERMVAKLDHGNHVGSALPPLDVMFLHSMLNKEDQDAAIAPSRPGALKVIIATNIAESSLTIPNVRVVFDLGHQVQVDYSGHLLSGVTVSRVWCSKASARQRAGRVGRLFPGVVIRLYTRETFNNLPAHEKPDIALQNVGSNILRVKSLFQSRFHKFSVVELLDQLLDAPDSAAVKLSMQELESLGAIITETRSSSDHACELTLLGRLATELSSDVDLARFVLLGVAAGCGVDCVIMAAGISVRDDLFNQPFVVNSSGIVSKPRDPMFIQERRISNLRARLHFHGGLSSDLLVYCRVYQEWLHSRLTYTESQIKQWDRWSELRQSTLAFFLRQVRDYAEKTVAFLTKEFIHGMQDELRKLRTLAAVDPSRVHLTRYGPGRENMVKIPQLCSNVRVVQIAIAGAFSKNWLIGFPLKDLQSIAESQELEKSNMPAHLCFKLTRVPRNLAGPDIQKLEMALKVLGPIQKVVSLGGQAVLVICRDEQMTSVLQSPPVISDLPDVARLANYMAICFSSNRELVIHTREINSGSEPVKKMEEINLGKPSGSQRIKWIAKIGSEVRGVQFQRMNLLRGSVEVRKHIPFHIAVAARLSHKSDGSDVVASNVTVLPQDNLFCVLILLLFRPSGVPDGEIQFRLHSTSDRIYSVRYQGVSLELAPRFISLHALRYIDSQREKHKGLLVSGAEITGNWTLAGDIVNLLKYIRATDYGAPLLAPELGPWLMYPSLTPVPAQVLNKSKKDTSKSDVATHEQCRLSSHQQIIPDERSKLGSHQHIIPNVQCQSGLRQQIRADCAPSIQGARACPPVLVQSRNDLGHSLHHYRSVERLPSKSLTDLQLFEKSFEEAQVPVEKRELIKWIGGDQSQNGVFSELLKTLARNAGDMECTKNVLQYVYSRRSELINRKQRKEMEGLYHSICNPDLGAFGNAIPVSTVGAKARLNCVQLQTQKSEVRVWNERRSFTPEISEYHSFITRQVTVEHGKRDLVISLFCHHQFAARITLGAFSSSQRPGLVTVSGNTTDVEHALQGIETIVNGKQIFHCWIIDETYIELTNMDQKVRCVDANHGCPDHSSNELVKKRFPPFFLVGDSPGEISRANSQSCGASPLFNARMKEQFEKVLTGLHPSSNVEVHARLGRVIFASSNEFVKQLRFHGAQAKPLGELRKYFDRHQISKQRFNDTVLDKEFYHLRAGLHLCNPDTVERQKKFVILVSNPTGKGKRDRELKLSITDAIDAPGRFRLLRVDRRTKLAVADIVRLNSGACQVDVRLAMQLVEQVYEEDEEGYEVAHEFVSKILRKGSKLEFPSEPYGLQLQREKDCEIFRFDDLRVVLTTVTQTEGLDSRSKYKYEVEFESIQAPPEVCPVEVAPPPLRERLTSKIDGLLNHVQNLCNQMSLRGPSSTATGIAQALLRSWKTDKDETLIKGILSQNFLPTEAVVGGGQEQVSMQICSLVEMLCHSDSQMLLKGGPDVASELQLVILKNLQTMNIFLSEFTVGRVRELLASHRLEPENALQYASLLKCWCRSPYSASTWDSVLRPYIMQLVLESDQSGALGEFFSRMSVSSEIRNDYSSLQLIDAIMQSSIRTTVLALRRLIDRDNISIFFQVLTSVVTYQETLIGGEAATLVRCFVRDFLGFCGGSKATSFVQKCLEWTVENESSIADSKTHMEIVFWLLRTIKMLDFSIDEHCRTKVLDLLLSLPSSMERKRDLEEALLDTYMVDETSFRNLHYQQILQQLGHLSDSHKRELKRRGLDEQQCHDFNFRSWFPGKIRGRDAMGSSLIPGLNEGGTRLVGTRGIFIPARDPSGQITGGQIKVDDNPTGKKKYVWLSSNNLFKGGKGPQIGGELPLFCCIPRDRDRSIVGFCEGGLKAHVLAALSGLPVIGASGADFSRSENLLQSYLGMIDVEQIIFFPDAGSQCNDQVISCYFQTFRLLRDLGYKVLVAWWGQVNKTEHDDIDDYLAKHSGSTIEIPYFSTSQFWQIVNLDVRDSIQENFPEYKLPTVRVSDVGSESAQADGTFTDEDQITLMEIGGSRTQFQIRVPKEVMKKMPRAPDDYVTPQSVGIFTIEVRLVEIDDPAGVEAAIDWLMPERSHASKPLLGLDCEHGPSGDLNLIQLSMHQRCVLISLSSARDDLVCPSNLATLLRDETLVKSGVEVHNDALAIYHTLGLMVNGLLNVSPAFTTAKRTAGMLEIFRTLYGWEWTKKKAVTRSEWGSATLTPEQIKYAALDAWASRMIALEGPAALDHTPVLCSVVGLENLPEELLKLFARAISHNSLLQRKEKTVFETSASISQSSRGTLRLVQHDFRARVTSVGSRVELRFNDGRKPALFEAQTRTGKSVVISPLNDQSQPSGTRASAVLPFDINAISNVFLDNSKSRNPQFQRLREVFYELLCHPDRCPRLLNLALTSGPVSQFQELKISNVRTVQLNGPVCSTASAVSENSPLSGKETIATKSERVERTKGSLNSQKLKHGHGIQAKTNNRKKIEGTPNPQVSEHGPAFPREKSQLSLECFQEAFTSLNVNQREALQQILMSPLSATIGPPGTGKTRLITAVAKAWLQARREQEVLLLTAYQNVAARNLAEALTEEQVPGALLLVSEDYFVDWHENFYEKLAHSVVVTKARCELPGALEDWRTRNKRKTVPILVCTLSLVGSAAFTRSLMGGNVTAMVVDECSQAAEGDCIYPLTCLPELSMLAVLGDPHQLPPFSSSGKGSRSVPKVQSVFDLVANGCEVKLLREQYRMPPTICSFISAEIYADELQTSPNRRNEQDWPHPLLWINVQGAAAIDPGKTSMYNTAEAQAILQVCQKLAKCHTGKQVRREIVVLTLYEEQNRRISKLLEAENLLESVAVHNVDSFQGQQSDIVLISLVAGTHFSPFAADRHRACVMLTRVKRFLCVCGNYDAVRRNARADAGLLWQSLAAFCGDRKLIASVNDADSLLAANVRATASS